MTEQQQYDLIDFLRENLDIRLSLDEDDDLRVRLIIEKEHEDILICEDYIGLPDGKD